jgi:hypothetical protein
VRALATTSLPISDLSTSACPLPDVLTAGIRLNAPDLRKVAGILPHGRPAFRK